MHHNPIALLVHLGTRWIVAGIVVAVLASPVTWGIGLALYDHFTGTDRGSQFLGNESAKPAAPKTDRVPQRRIYFPGKQVPT